MKDLVLVITLLMLAASSFAQTITGSITHDDLQRDYRLYVPSVYDGSEAVPLVFNLHGYTSNAWQQELYGDFRPVADTANFLLVHPDGTTDATGTTFWNAFGSPTETVDDVGFLSALIDSLNTEYNIDLNRVYTTGMSNGGFMSYKLSCDLSHRIAAMASVTGSMRGGLMSECFPTHPIPVLEIHGTADPTVPYNGNQNFGMEPIPDVISFWVNFNNCNATAIETAVPDINMTDGCTTDHFLYENGDNGSTVEHYRVNDGAHTWPGAILPIGVTSQDFSASVEIWRFFSQYRLNELVSVEDLDNQRISISVYPNPSNGQVQVRFDGPASRYLEIRNALGQIVESFQTNRSYVDLNLYDSGVYFLIVEEDGIQESKKLVVE